VYFRVLGRITAPETIAVGGAIREGGRLRRLYGPARWRKRKGVARVELPDGAVRLAEVHWYEATGIGKREYKIKRYLD
jgi:O-acetyl-ADP-ribose deacetylase (regulator of RNase III)